MGAMLLNPDAADAAIAILKGRGDQVFYHEPHRYVYDAMVDLWRETTPIDAVTLMNRLIVDGRLTDAGGATYIAELTRAVPTSANIEVYARLVLDQALLRLFIMDTSRLTSEAYAGRTEPAELFDKAEATIMRLASVRHAPNVSTISDIAAASLEKLITQIESKSTITGIPCGFKDIDQILGGLQPGTMVVVAARPSVGKTAFALNIATNVAALGYGVQINSLEMSKASLGNRLLCHIAQVDGRDLRKGFLSRSKIPILQDGADRLSRLPITIEDSMDGTILDLRSRVRQMVSRHGVKVVIIDYLQLMSGEGENRQVQIASITRGIKRLANELNICIIALSQLSREAEKNDTAQLSHLRESGAIEQDADVVMMLQRTKEPGKMILNIAKHREGETGLVHLVFQPHLSTFHCAGSVPDQQATRQQYAPQDSIENEYYEEDDMDF